MNIPLRRKALAAVLAVISAGTVQAATRLDASLSLLAAQPQFAVALDPVLLKGNRFAGEQLIAATVRFTGYPINELNALGVRIGSVSGNIATVDIPLSKINAVAAIPGVIFVESAKVLHPRLDSSVPATHADTLRSGTAPNWTGAAGAGVIIGVVDDGLDFRHLDFRKADGTTRLLGLWDMRDAASGTPPAGFNFGAECTPALLNQAITEGTSSKACTQPSSGNHGTHVGGIAAGNGQGTGNGQAAYRFIGMAPQADIISANAIASGISGTSNSVIDAVSYIKAKAQALNKAAVINLSLGSYFGNRDSTSNYETALANANGKGVILVAAAGNEGSDPLRAVATLAEGGSVTVSYNIGTQVTASQRIEMWYPGANQWSVKVASADGSCVSDVVVAGTPSYAKDTACGALSIANNDVNPLNDDRQVLINFSANAAGKGPQGDWRITVSAVKGGGAVSMMGGEDGNGGLFTSNTEPVTAQILTDTCSSNTTICVGAYVTKQKWNSLSGPSTITDHGAIGDLAKFSSRGPRRDCSNLAKCPQTLKPEIVAPGAMIISTLAWDAKKNDPTTVEADGVHIALNGTSMATPHVAGAVALLLQKNPNLTPDDVRKALFGNVQSNAFTPTTLSIFDLNVKLPKNANYGWGYGIMDIAKAYAAVSAGTATPTSTVAQFTGNPAGDSSNLTLTAHITPASSDIGKAVKVYLAALLPTGQIYINNQGSWQPLGSPISFFQSSTAGNAGIDINIFSGFNLSALIGTQIIVGYGSDDADMLSKGRFKVVHTIK